MNEKANTESTAPRRRLDIAFCANDGYVGYLCVTLKSIACNHAGDFDIAVHILTDDITPVSASRIADALGSDPTISHKIYMVDDSSLEGVKISHYTKYSWYRMLLPDLLPDVDKIFYLDTDTVVADSLREIFDYDITPYAIATPPDSDSFIDEPYVRCGYPKALGYVCSGVMMINLKYWRDHDISAKVISWCRENAEKVKYPDQDSINYVCREHKGYLPLRYGVTRSVFTTDWFYTPQMREQLQQCLDRPAVVHYAGCAPWVREYDHPLNHIWLRYNSMLPHPAPRRYSAKGLLKYKLMAWDALHPEGRRAMTCDQIRAKIDAIDSPPSGGRGTCRLLFFIESLQCGGAEKSLVSLLPLLDPDKYDIDLMVLRRDGIFMKYVPDWVNVVDFPAPRPGIKSRLGQAAFAMKWRLLRSLGAKRHNAETRWPLISPSLPELSRSYDVAIAYQQGFPTYYVATKVNARVKCAWVNIDLEGAGYRPSFNRPFYDRFDHIVAVSRQLFDNLSASRYVDASRLTTIYDILNVDLIRRLALEPLCMEGTVGLRPADGCSRTTLNLVTVGRLSRQKNYPLAVETARVLRDRGIDFRWVFVGDGAERSAIEALIDRYGLDGKVVLAGLQENPYKYMQHADIYVHTASFEGFGLTIAEAKILGKPVVSTNFNIVYDQITDGLNGLIAEMTPESVTDCIVRLHSDTKLLSSIVDAVAAESNTTATTEVAKFDKMLASSLKNQK